MLKTEKLENIDIKSSTYNNYKTREVSIGNTPLGGDNPIRIQSMTTTDTMDTIGTVEQSIRMIEAGCEYVRITAPSKNEAENLKNIKDELKIRGYDTPLIADIHFTPNAALIAARIVEKVRINPGNFVDKKKFQILEYSDSQYLEEIDRIREKFTPLVKVCKEYGTAIRIGTNHGSLSDRIMSRFGDTPLGMVESALEFVRICEDENYYNIILSMKSSNPQVMVNAYRLLVKKMQEEGMNYPLHLGVTEAGGGEEGRIKSAVGIGTLLEDGLGDTIRVSLTEEPEYEIPVAKLLVDRYKDLKKDNSIYKSIEHLEYEKRETYSVENIGNDNLPIVFSDFSQKKLSDKIELKKIGYFYNRLTDKWGISDLAADFIYFGDKPSTIELPKSLKAVYNYKIWAELENEKINYPLFTFSEYFIGKKKHESLNFIECKLSDFKTEFIEVLKKDTSIVLVLKTDEKFRLNEFRVAFEKLNFNNIKTPIIIKNSYSNIDFGKIRVYSSIDFGGLLIEGFGNGAWIEDNNNYPSDKINELIFGILQAARVRITKTEYIACPSCGRTLFDLQETTEMIRKKTLQLKGIKIAVMGCIVNGPGEMADADYGYVGSGVDKITLYRGKNIVKRNVESSLAVNFLIDLIKEDNNWVEPN